MTRLRSIDYEAGMALFEADGRFVVVDTNKKDVVQVVTELEAVTASAWLKVGPTLDYPKVWQELADAAVTTLDVQEEEVVTAERTYRIPNAVKVEAQQALDWVAGFDRGKSTVGASFASRLLAEKELSAADIARLDRYFSRISKRSLSTGWEPGQQGYPTDERIRFAMRGGEAARAWVSKIVSRHGLTAAGEGDGNKPHEYQDDPEIPGSCAICGRDATASIHTGLVAGAFEYDPTCEYFGVGVSPDETLVTGLLMLRPDGSWDVREKNNWEPTVEPGEDQVLIMLDEESAYRLAEVLDDIVPGDPNVLPYELALINPHEAALAALALEEEGEWEYVDRVMEMFDIYDSQERAINAQKQGRAAGGRFGETPDDPAKPEGNQQGQTKARLPEGMPLVPDIAARIQEYLAANGGTPAPEETETAKPQPQGLSTEYVNSLIDKYGDTEFGRQELATEFNWVEDTGGLPKYIKRIAKHLREKGMTEGHAIASAVNAAEKMCATGDLNFPGKQDVNPGSKAEACKAVAEWNAKKARAKADNALRQFADGQPDATAASAARPLYLALVDKVDTEAVLDLVSLMPGNPPVMWKRDGGAWVQAPEILAALQGTQPPPVVELTDDAIVADVINQVDESTGGETEEPDAAPAPGATPQSPTGASGPKPDANPDQQRRAASTIVEMTMFGPHGELLDLTQFAGGLDQNRGNAEELRKYWTRGKGGLKIRWNTPGDMTRCMRHLRKYLGGREAGYCALRHREMTGRWPGERDENGNL